MPWCRRITIISAQHMFFFHRFQHLVLHHLGPFLIALGVPGAGAVGGMPDFLKPVLRVAAGARCRRFHPASGRRAGSVRGADLSLAGARDPCARDAGRRSLRADELEHGDRRHLLLVPGARSAAEAARARSASAWRALLTVAVVPPQILVGALLALTNSDIYPVYRICGRILPITAITDQHYGGLILWIPSSMMSVIALFLVLNNLRLNEERADHALAEAS